MSSIIQKWIYMFVMGVYLIWIVVRFVSDFQSHLEHQAWKSAFYKTKNKIKCPNCDLFLCICQSGLSEFGFELVKPLKDPTIEQKIFNCPHRCLNSGVECLNCSDFDKFKALVIIK